MRIFYGSVLGFSSQLINCALFLPNILPIFHVIFPIWFSYVLSCILDHPSGIFFLLKYILKKFLWERIICSKINCSPLENVFILPSLLIHGFVVQANLVWCAFCLWFRSLFHSLLASIVVCKCAMHLLDYIIVTAAFMLFVLFFFMNGLLQYYYNLFISFHTHCTPYIYKFISNQSWEFI